MKSSEDVISREVSKILSDLKGVVYGREILSKLSNFCNADDSMLYALMGAEVISPVSPAKSIRDYKYSIKGNKAKDKELIKSILFGGKREGVPEFRLVASFPENNKFKEIKEVDSLYPMLCRLIISAKSQLIMVNPYFDDEGIEKLMPYIKKASERGVKIKIISRSGQWGSQSEKLDSLMGTLDKNCEIRYFAGIASKKPSHLHAKFMVADNKMAYVGSANITRTSLGENIEVGTIFTGNEAKTLLKFFDVVWQLSENKQDGWY